MATAYLPPNRSEQAAKTQGDERTRTEREPRDQAARHKQPRARHDGLKGEEPDAGDKLMRQFRKGNHGPLVVSEPDQELDAHTRKDKAAKPATAQRTRGARVLHRAMGASETTG